MGNIKELDSDLINKIAAGEVIESPASVAKELIENSLDSGANLIEVSTTNAGLTKLEIVDNGCGILEEDLELSVKRHATSKIKRLSDLEAILTYGFRGEALSSIAAVSKLTVQSGTSESLLSHGIYAESGIINKKQILPGRLGTRILVEDLFFNTPVRRKFLKSEKSEDRKLKTVIETIAICRDDVQFKVFQDGKNTTNLPIKNRKERIISIFGENIREHLLEVSLEQRGIKAEGFISDPDFYRSNRSGQFIFVNNRPIEIKYSSFLLKKAYDELIPSGSHPWCFLFFTIDPHRIDVNVHPTKKEIRFLDEENFNAFFMKLIQARLHSSTPIEFIELKHKLSNQPPITPIPLRANSPVVENSDFQELLHNNLYTTITKRESYPLNVASAGTQLNTLSNPISKNRSFIPKKHYGVVFETFILAEAEDGLYIIDQHTAHERIRYEEILKVYKENQNLYQKLLTPIKIELSIQDANEVMDKKEDFHSIGFTIDSFGDGTVVVREVPIFLEPGTEKEVILEFISRMKGVSEPQLYDLMAKTVACRSAIKKGDQVSDHILAEILNRLSYCENPSRCPHGRPTLIKLTKGDLEKMFYRK